MEKLPLYHGTDIRILEMSDRERDDFNKRCVLATEYLWELFDPYYNQYIRVVTNKPCEGCWEKVRRLEELKPILIASDDAVKFHNLCNALYRVDAQRRDIGGYQYGDIYLTNMISRAINYARRSFAFGEIGLNVYRMLDAAETINFPDWAPGPEVEEALTVIKNFAGSEAQPAVLEIDEYDIGKLRVEDGSPLYPFQLPDHKLYAGMSFRYLGVLPLRNFKLMTVEEASNLLNETESPF